MFDGFLRERSRRTGQPFVPFDPVDGLRRVRRRQAPRRRDALVPGLPRHRAARGPRGRSAGRADRPRPRQPQERDRAAADPRRTGWRPTRARSATCAAARDAGLRRAVVSSSANCRDVLVAAGIEDLFEARIDGVVAEREHLRGKPAPDTFLAGARALGLEPAAGGGLRGRAGRRGGRPGGQVRLRGRRRPRRPGRRAAGARRRRRRHRPRRAAGPLVIKQPAFTRGAVVRCGRPQLDLDLLAQTESVFALSNGHLGWRGQPGRGRAARPAGHLPQRGLRGAAAALRRGRLRPAGVRADGHQRHQRQADPAVRRRRAVRRPLRRAARARARAGLPGGRAEPPAPSGCRRPAGRSGSPRPGWCRSPSARSRPSATRWSRSTGPARIAVQSELLANEQLPPPSGDPRARRRARSTRSTGGVSGRTTGRP